MSANARIKTMKNRADDLTNKELIIRRNRIRHARILFIRAVFAFASTSDRNNARVSRNCAQTTNAATALNSLIAKICHALIIFLFSQKRNLLRITNLTSEEESEKEDEEDKEDEEEEENNEKEKVIKKAKTRRRRSRSRDENADASESEIKILIKR